MSAKMSAAILQICYLVASVVPMMLSSPSTKYPPPCRRHLLRDPVGRELQPEFLKFKFLGEMGDAATSFGDPK